MSPRELVKLAHDLQGRSAATVDAELQRRKLSTEERIAVHHEMTATAQRRSLKASLATDSAEWHPAERPMQPLTEIERLMVKAGLQPGGQYTELEIEERCQQAGIVEPSQRLGIKIEAEQRGMLKPRRAGQDIRSLYGRSMQASAERPRSTPLKDASGRPVTLRSRP